MKNIYKSFFILIALLSGCQKELTNINVNPNNLESPDINTLTSNVIVSEFWNSTNNAWTLGNAMSQTVVFSQSYYNGSDGARFYPVNLGPYWVSCYSNARDAATIVAQSKKANKPGNQAVGMALQAFAFTELTNLWGDIPYKQALQGQAGIFTVGYDDQQTIYSDPRVGILARLSSADSLLASNPTALISGDVLYGGNVTKWRKFINALRLRALIRISAKQDVSAAMQSIASGGVTFQSASESATLPLPAAGSYIFPSYFDRAGDFSIKVMDSILYNFYVNTGDQARMTLLFNPSPNGAGNSTFSFSNYGGMPQVIDATTTQNKAASTFSDSYNPLKTYLSLPITSSRLITYAEVQFILAEAALKGYISGGVSQAQTYYNNGVLGAYAELGLSSSSAAAYLANKGTAFNPDPSNNYQAALTQVIMQKWALNLNTGFEGWLENRRTGIPALSTKYNQNNGLISNKFLYPIDEQTINSVNFNNELKKFPGNKDNINYRAWW